MAPPPNQAVNLLTEALVKYKHELKSQYQKHLDNIESGIRNWLRSAESNLTVENLDSVFTRFMAVRDSDIVLPGIDVNAVRAILSQDKGVLELQNRIAHLEYRNKVLASDLAFVPPGFIESNKERQVAVAKITVVLKQQMHPSRDAVPQSVWNNLISTVANARKKVEGVDLEIFEVIITGRRVSIIQTQDAVRVPQSVWDKLASAIADAREEIKGADLEIFNGIIASCKVPTKERDETTGKSLPAVGRRKFQNPTRSTDIRTRNAGKDGRLQANVRQTVAGMEHEVTGLGKTGRETAGERNGDEDHIGETAVSVISLSSGDEDEEHWQVMAEESAGEVWSKNLPENNDISVDHLVKVYTLAAKEISPINYRPDPSLRLRGKTVTQYLRERKKGEASRAAMTKMQDIAAGNSLMRAADTTQIYDIQKDSGGDLKRNRNDLSAAEKLGTYQHSGILQKHATVAEPIRPMQQVGPSKDNTMDQPNPDSFRQNFRDEVSARTRLDLAVNCEPITIDLTVDEMIGSSKPKPRKCYYCNVVGHRHKRCPKREADRRSLEVAVATRPSKAWEVNCYYCHAHGHNFVGHEYRDVMQCQKLWFGQPGKEVAEAQSSSELQETSRHPPLVQRMCEYCSGLDHSKKDCEHWKAKVRVAKVFNDLYNKQTSIGTPEIGAPVEGHISYIRQGEDVRQPRGASSAEQQVQQESIDNMKDDIKKDPSTYPQENLYDSETVVEDGLVSNARATKKSREEVGITDTPRHPAKRARLMTSRDENWASAQRRLEGGGRRLVGSVSNVLPRQKNFMVTGESVLTEWRDKATRDGTIIVQNISTKERGGLKYQRLLEEISTKTTKKKKTSAHRRAQCSAGGEPKFDTLAGPRSYITVRGVQADGEPETVGTAQEADHFPGQQIVGSISRSSGGGDRSPPENTSSVLPAFMPPIGPTADNIATREPASRVRASEQELEVLQGGQHVADLVVFSSDSRERSMSKLRHCVVAAALNPQKSQEEAYNVPLAKVMGNEAADLRGVQLAAASIRSTGPSLHECKDNKASGASCAAISNTIYKLLDNTYWSERTGELREGQTAAFIGPLLPAVRSSVVSGFLPPTGLSRKAQELQEELAPDPEGFQGEKQAANLLDSSGELGVPKTSLDSGGLVCQNYQKNCDTRKPVCSGCKGDCLLCTWPQTTSGSNCSPEDTSGKTQYSRSSSEESTRGYLRYYDLPDRDVEEA